MTERFFASLKEAKDDTAALLKGQYQMSTEDDNKGGRRPRMDVVKDVAIAQAAVVVNVANDVRVLVMTGLAVTMIVADRVSLDRATRKRVRIPASALPSVLHVQALHRAAKPRP
ncbi:hypothetical protein HED51_16960 [Ochrobactrum grignonense]|nr:hypothetical protein [Brucella grignonensis]